MLLLALLPLSALAWASAQPSAGRAESLACSELVVFVRAGCPHCAAARSFTEALQARHGALTVRYRDVVEDPGAAHAFERVNRERRIQQPGVPTFVACGEVLVGFSDGDSTGRLLEGLLTGEIESLSERLTVRLPLLGTVAPGDLGLPAFTLFVGLVDGFNPCATWVLLFLLSLLVHVRRRSRIALIASTFVLMSGVVYFAFMAAWLNLFLVLGYSRALQVTLGLVAVAMGAIHVKDFFAFHRGVSLSIPPGARPGIAARIRRVMQAENLPAALLGIAGLALLVNLVELLCTAGLPALYTQVLTYYPLSDGAYYGYLLLYNLAYVLDDAVLVVLAVVTLGQRRLREREGRWLKLMSGLLILGLGLAMLLAPELLTV